MNSDKEPASSESTRIRIEPHKPINTHSAYDLHQPSRLQWNNSPPRDRSDFEIAIICALPLEASVVSELFDRRYDEKAYGKAQGDSNAYSTGVIGNHNVVLVHMPDMGKVAAATAAACLHSSFQNIQLALTVGICGAAPFDPQSGKDIHIGDVVISEGLIQYDLGRQYPNNTFMRKDTPRDNLPRPRPKVRAVLAKLKTKQGLYWLQNQLSEHLKAFPQKLSETAPHPGAIEDELFTNGSVTNPTTHFGLIASGDTVMKSAEDRDFIISRDGVIAFEMEGAGVWEKFPHSLVIKGVCDYADSHKNKKWQDYAATTAAAVTKAFLEHWSTALKLIDVLITDTPRAPSSDARARESEEERTRRAKEIEILKMLYRSPYLDQKDRNLDRISGTCEWFVSHRLFKEWQEKKSTRTLWISADPGCGKSVLAKYLIDHVLPSTDLRTTCYFFFKDDFEDQRSIIIALCCILHQLFTQKPALLSKAIFERFQATGEEFARSFRELWDALLCATDENAGEIVCVLDAIDECEDDGRARLSQALRELYSTSTKRCSNLKFLLTSRPYGKIRQGFRPSELPESPIIHLSGESEDEMKKISLEIDIFIKAKVQDIGRQLRLRDDEEDLLLHELMRVPNRTYLWVRLTLDLIESDVNIDKSKIVKITSNLPATVDEAYERILSKSRNLEEARKLLQIVVAAERPLTLEEMNLAMALALRDGHQSYDDVDLKPVERFREEIRDLCGLIVTIVNSKIYLLHQTVKEFLVPATNGSGDTKNLIQMKDCFKWKYSLRPLDSHSVLATICLQHLQFTEFGLEPQDDLPTPSEYANKYVFLDYSAKNWFTHIHESQVGLEGIKTQWGEDQTKTILKLCDAGTRRCQTWLKLYWTSTNMVFPTKFATFLIISYFGFTTAIGYLPESAGPGLNWRDGTYSRTALSWAAGNGFTHTVDRLVSINNTWWGAILFERADIDAIDMSGRTPLFYAVWNRHIPIVELLLNAGARVDIEDDVGGTPLSYAICSGNDDMAKLLLKKGAQADSKESIIRTLLFASAKKGDRDVVELLLETGIVDPNEKDSDGLTLLLWATFHNHKTVISLLVKAGARLDYKGIEGYILFCQALLEGDESAVEQLFEAGLQLTYPFYEILTSGRPIRSIVPEFRNNHNTKILSPVAWAVEKGYERIVKLLLKNDFVADDRIGRKWEMLSLAIEYGDAAMVRLLLGQKAAKNFSYNINITPLSRAAERGDEAIVELLLEHGAEPYLADHSGGTPMSRAANTKVRNIIGVYCHFHRHRKYRPERIRTKRPQ
ncbi:hypothetical protein TWF788_007036 [Orbilia oligospora]|uniref:NACHT domain-containing protein n=1 Tax=Orbilia oligospora TaxID=2813651 RepID=A0A7C8PTT6_ORBOL|nr:hypothetical protein TWF788_007036 [Orbilia oligospora]